MVVGVGILDDWRFCPRCGGSLTALDGRVRCEQGHEHWANPVPGSQALVEREGRVLLGRRGTEPGLGRWDIPGGFVHEDEHPLEALHRELREETGLEIEPTELFGIWMQRYDGRTVLCLTWIAEVAGGMERPGDDLVELRWFGPDELPAPDELAFETFVEILSLWRTRHQHA